MKRLPDWSLAAAVLDWLLMLLVPVILLTACAYVLRLI